MTAHFPLILYVPAPGCRRGKMLGKYCHPTTAWRRLKRYQQSGVWQKILERLLDAGYKLGKINLDLFNLFFICVVMSGSVEGATYYVSTQGNDANDGLSERSAWRTISHAAKVAKVGNTVLVLPGDYGPERVVVANSGRCSRRFSLLEAR